MEEGINLAEWGKIMKDQKEKIGNISFNEEMQPVTWAKERTILDDDDIGKKG